jgi:hypothetical protein
MDKHTALLEGVAEISRHLLWAAIAERYFLPIATDVRSQLQLKQDFVCLYKTMLLFLARAKRFLEENRFSKLCFC